MEVYHASTVAKKPSTPSSKQSTLVSSMRFEMHSVSLEEAMDIFYNSPLLPLLEEGIADLHCRSDKYLAEEIWREQGQGTGT